MDDDSSKNIACSSLVETVNNSERSLSMLSKFDTLEKIGTDVVMMSRKLELSRDLYSEDDILLSDVYASFLGEV